jgi:hypothetical protein
MNFDIDICLDEHINDPLAMGQVEIVRQILNLAEQVTNAGRRVIIKRNFVNAPVQIIATLTTTEQIQEWRTKLDEAQEILGKPIISGSNGKH